MVSNDKRAFIYYCGYSHFLVCILGHIFRSFYLLDFFFLPETYLFDLNKAVKIFEFLRYLDKLHTVL